MLDTVGETEQVIRRMSASVNLMNDMVEQISEAAGQQSAASQEIALHVESLSRKESENAGWMDACDRDLQALTAAVSRLDGVVGRFRT
jgi:methyl-accepting chemotaxis protein